MLGLQRRTFFVASSAVVGATLAAVAFVNERMPEPKRMEFVVPRVIPPTEAAPGLVLRGQVRTPADAVGSSPGEAASSAQSTLVEVRDDTGAPVREATVRVGRVRPLVEESPLMVFSDVTHVGKTDSLGQAVVEVLPTALPVQLEVRAASYRPVSVQVDSVPRAPVRVQLMRGSKVSGSVTSPNGSPVPGVRVVAIPAGALADAPERGVLASSIPWCETLSDADGTFHFGGLRERFAYRVRVADSGWQSPTESAVPGSSGEVRLVCQAIRFIRFVAVDAETDQPITLQGLGWSLRDPTLAPSQRGGAFTSTTVFTSSGRLDAWHHADSRVTTQHLLLDGQPLTSEVEVLFNWLSPDMIYAPVYAQMRLFKPDELLHAAHVQRVQLRPLQRETWAGRLRVFEVGAGGSEAPTGSLRFLEFWSSDEPSARQAARGLRDGATWLYGPIRTGSIKCRVLASGNRWSDTASVSVSGSGHTALEVRFPPLTGFALSIVNNDGTPFFGLDSAYVCRLDMLGGSELHEDKRTYLAVACLDPLDPGPSAPHGVGAPGPYRAVAYAAGLPLGTADFEVVLGQVTPVRIVMSSQDGR